MSADRSVTDLETTALEGIDSWAEQPKEASRAAVRELARRAEQADEWRELAGKGHATALDMLRAAEADRDRLRRIAAEDTKVIHGLSADRDRLRRLVVEHHSINAMADMEWGGRCPVCSARPDLSAALATPDTLPPHVERAIREVEKTATKEVREQTGRDDLVVEFDRRAATPDTPPTSRYSGTPDSPTVRNGVCLLCGSAILSSGIHLRADLPPCYGAPDTPPDARC
jgi:hypothetical protein